MRTKALVYKTAMLISACIFLLPYRAFPEPQNRTDVVWVDPTTHLMWARKDNEVNVALDAAKSYCQTLRLGGYADWRLPEVEELDSIYDPSANRTFTYNEKAYEYHVKGGLVLTGWAWSDTVWGTNGFGKNNYASNFSEPGRNWGTIGRADGHRALCVRRSTPQKSGIAVAGATGSATSKTLEILEKAADAGNVRAMEMLGYVYFTGKEGVPKDETGALSWFKKAATRNSVLGKLYLARMYDNGWGTKRDVGSAYKYYEQLMVGKETPPELREQITPEWNVVQTKTYQDYDATSRGDYIDAEGKMHKAGLTPSYSEKDKKYMEIMKVAVTAAVVAAMISGADSGHTGSSSHDGLCWSCHCSGEPGSVCLESGCYWDSCW